MLLEKVLDIIVNGVLISIVTEVIAWHAENALSPIEETLLPIETEVRSEQPENAEPPIEVTLLGMVTVVKLVHLWKA